MWWSRVPVGTWEVAGPRRHLDDAAQQLCRGGFWLEMGVWEGSPPLLWQLKPWKRVRSAKEREQRVERPIFWEIGVTPSHTRLWALMAPSGSQQATVPVRERRAWEKRWLGFSLWNGHVILGTGLAPQ